MRSLGRYELLEPIGSGGMAKVHLGRARGAGGFERMVAIKVCHPHLRDDPAFVARFLEEARLAAKIRHPNVVATLDCGEQGSDLYLVMEWIEGDRLAGLLEGGALQAPIAARIVCDALAGLQAAHDLGSVHRDVSPQNVLVGVDGVSRIADFGLAKALGSATVSRNDAGELRGKVAYMAPEQILADKEHGIGPAIDVWAAGVVLWEALTGKRLFARETEAESINAVLRAKVDEPTGDPHIDSVVLKALARDVNDRWPSAHEMQLALESAIALPPSRAVGEVVRAAANVAGRAALRDAPVASVPAPSASSPSEEASASPRPNVAAQRGRVGLVALLSFAALGIVAAAVFLRGERETPPSVPTVTSVPKATTPSESLPRATDAPLEPPPAAPSAPPPRPQVAVKKPPSPRVGSESVAPKASASSGGYWPKEP